METSQITLTEAPKLCVHPQSFLVFKLETAASSHKNTMFWNCIDMFLAQKKNKLQMQPIRKLELPFVSAGLKTLRGKPKQQIKLIHGKMQSVRTGTQIPILKLARALEGITYPLKFLGRSHQVPWDDAAGDALEVIPQDGKSLLKASYLRAIFCEATPLRNSFTCSLHASSALPPLQPPLQAIALPTEVMI